jgi:hypothetical protein
MRFLILPIKPGLKKKYEMLIMERFLSFKNFSNKIQD